MAQRGEHIRHRMQDVGADNHVVGFGFKTLLSPWFFQIKDFAFHLREGRQLAQRRREEACGNIGKGVSVQATVEQWQQMRRQAAGTRPHFQNAQTAPFRQVARCLLHTAGDGRHPVAGEQAVSIELVQQLGIRAGEKNLDGIFLAPQNGSEFATGAGAQHSLGQMARMFFEE